MGIIETIGNWVIQLISQAGYIGVFLAMAIESCLIPLPSEITMPFAGALAQQGQFNLYLVAFVGAFGNLIGSVCAYTIGYKFPEGVILSFLRKWGKFLFLTEHEYMKAKGWLSRYGSFVSFFSRLLPGIRTVISLPAGVARINLFKFSIFTFLGSFIWSFILALLGYLLGENWEQMKIYFHRFNILIIFFIFLLVGVYIYKHIKRKKLSE